MKTAAPSSISVSSAEVSADLILYNGRIHTVDARDSIAQAIAIAGDRILAVGAERDALALARPHTRRIDLRGQTVVPGLIDSHAHLNSLGATLLTLDLRGAASYAEVVEAAAAYAVGKAPGEWIYGRSWDHSLWRDQTLPTHTPLSRAIPNHPVMLRRVDGHAAIVNAAAMRLAGLTRDTPDPPGGKIARDPATGEPTGLLVDAAMRLVSRHIPDATDAEIRDAARAAIRECARHGLTGVHDAGTGAAMLRVYREMIDAGEFDLRLYAMVSCGDPAALAERLAAGPLIGYGRGRLTARCVKTFLDGALGSSGAAMLEPYADEPDNAGLLVSTPERVADIARRAMAAGFQTAVHAIGDRANRLALDAFEAALRDAPPGADPRLRVEHAQIISPADIPRFAALGVIPSMQTVHALDDMRFADRRLGAPRARFAYAWRSLLDTGCRIPNGSDFPVAAVNPLVGFYAAITRQDFDGRPAGGWYPEQRMTRREALRSYTIDAAYAAFEEDIKGSLEPGKLADLVVLSGDIMDIAPRDILTTTVRLTVLGGRIVHSADAPAQ